MRKLTFLVALACVLVCTGHAQVNCNATPSPCVTLTGYLSASNGVAAQNFTLTFQPSQIFYVAGTGVSVSISTNCSTSVDGSVVGIGNPLITTSISPAFSGTLAAGTYYVQYTFYTSSPVAETLPSPEQSIQLTATGSLVVQPPSTGIPSNATGMKVYISSTSGAETLQGTTVGVANYTQSVPLVTGVVVPATNSSSCKQVANDAGWPTGTGYQVSLTDTSGNVYPGYPMLWALLGPGTTINVSNGLPYYHGVVTYPTPILASPLNHGPQSISGPLNLSTYNLTNIGRLGVGTSLPGFAIDSTGVINTGVGFTIAGAAPLGHCPVGNGTNYVDGVCLTSATTYYQTWRYNTVSPRTQRANSNVSQRFSVTDDATNNQTTIDLNATGAGNMVATATAGGLANNCVKWASSGDLADTGVPCYSGVDQYALSGPTCTTATTAQATCSSTFNWTQAFVDANYVVTCTGIGPSSGGAVVSIASFTASAVTLSIATQSAVAVSFSNVHCHGHHN